MVVGVVDLYLKLWGRNADIIVIGGPRRLASACRVEKKPRAMYFHTSLLYHNFSMRKDLLKIFYIGSNNHVFPKYSEKIL